MFPRQVTDSRRRSTRWIGSVRCVNFSRMPGAKALLSGLSALLLRRQSAEAPKYSARLNGGNIVARDTASDSTGSMDRGYRSIPPME